MTMPSTCLDESTLRALLRDEIPEPSVVELEIHLGSCDRCRERLQVLAGTAGFRVTNAARSRADPVSHALREVIDRLKAEGTGETGHPGIGPSPITVPPCLAGYRILGELGRGGMGIVYRARQEGLQREVALKVIRTGLLPRDPEVRRFRLEAEAAARLDHPNIVSIFEVGEQDGCHFFSMRLLTGGDLAAAIASRNAGREGAPTLPSGSTAWADGGFQAIASRMATVARAVHYAHLRGVLHRDLKPSNILLDDQGQPHITDFGLAKLLTADSDLTLSAAVLGTPGYMAPEQAAGKTREVTTAADIYSLGAILYELLTGQPPFREPSVAATLQKVIHAEPVSPRSLQPRLPPDLTVICLKCLEKDLTHRYPTAAALAEDLDRFHRGEPISAQPLGPWQKGAKWVRRQPALAASLGAVVLAFSTGFLATFWIWRKEVRQRQAAQEETARTLAANTSLELERAFRAGDTSLALQTLARLARQQPSHRVVSERLLNTLTYREFCLPLATLEHPVRDPARPDHRDLPPAGTPGLARLRVARFSRSGNLILTASADGVVQLWDGRNGMPLGAPRSLDGGVSWADFDPLATRVVTASRDGFARIWRVSDGQPDFPPLPHGSPVLHAGFSPDGRQLTTVTEFAARIWNLAAQTPGEPQLLAVDSPIHHAEFSPDGKQLVTVGPFGPARVWDLATRSAIQSLDHRFRPESLRPYPEHSPDSREILYFQGLTAFLQGIGADGNRNARRELRHDAEVIAAAYSPDGRYVATGAHDAKARIWQATDGSLVDTPLTHRQSVTTVQFSRDSRRLLTGSRDRSVRLRSLEPGKPSPEPLWHASAINEAWLNAAGDRILTAAGPTTAWLWEAGHRTDPEHTIDTARAVEHLRRSPASPLLVGVHRNGISFLDPTRPDPLLRAGPRVRFAPVVDVDFSPDGSRLVLGLENGSTLLCVVDGRRPEGPAYGRPGPPETRLRRIRFDPSGERFVTAADNGEVNIWNRNSHERPVWRRSLHRRANYAEFHPDGTRVVVGCWDRHAWLLDATTGTNLFDPLPHDGPVNWARFDRPGTRVVTASRDKTIRVWDAASGRLLLPPLRHAEVPAEEYPFDLSPDGAQLASIAGDRFYIWRLTDGKLLVGPVWVGSLVTSIRYSPDGVRLVTASDDGTACLWDAASGQPLREPWAHAKRVTCAEFSHDGSEVISTSWDGTVRIQPVVIPPVPLPPWWTEVAEALAGQRLEDRPPNLALGPEELLRWRRRLLGRADDAFDVAWARWFFLGEPWPRRSASARVDRNP